MFMKILFLGLSFAFGVSGLLGLVNAEDKEDSIIQVRMPDDDDDDEGVIETEDGVMLLSVNGFKLR